MHRRLNLRRFGSAAKRKLLATANALAAAQVTGELASLEQEWPFRSVTDNLNGKSRERSFRDERACGRTARGLQMCSKSDRAIEDATVVSQRCASRRPECCGAYDFNVSVNRHDRSNRVVG